MFLIKLDEHFSIRTDKYNYLLVRKATQKKKDRKKALEDVTYYNNMGHLLRCYFEFKVKSDINKHDIISLEGYYRQVKDFLAEINSKISPALGKRLQELYDDEEIIARK